jgi:hypothetical protein
MTETKGNGGAHTDIAALSAGVIAVVVTLFVTPGEYTVFNFIVSFTLIAIILAYVWPGARSWLQSLALAAAIGLTFMSIVGYVGEAILSQHGGEVLIGAYEWTCWTDPCNERLEHASRVPNSYVAAGWLGAMVLTFGVDLMVQHRRSSKRKLSSNSGVDRTVALRSGSEES